MASTSMLSGNDTARSTNEREASKVRERTRARPLNSGTSVVNMRVTSITGASSLPSASMLNAIRMRFVVRGLDRLRDRLTAIGDDVVGHAAQQHAVAAPLPLHHAAPDRLASLPGADRRPGDLA